MQHRTVHLLKKSLLVNLTVIECFHSHLVDLNGHSPREVISCLIVLKGLSKYHKCNIITHFQ